MHSKTCPRNSPEQAISPARSGNAFGARRAHKRLWTSEAPNDYSLIGATVNERINEAVSGAGARVLCGFGEWLKAREGSAVIQEKLPPDSCVIHLTNAEEIRHFLCNSELIGE